MSASNDHVLGMREGQGTVTFEVRVTPRASRSEVGNVQAGVLRVQLHAPPVEGEANAELVQVIARWLGVSRGAVKIVRGDKNRNKVVAVSGVTAAEIAAKLSA